jgi:hypothetical protein
MDSEPANRAFHNLQNHNTAMHLLLWYLDRNRLVPFGLIGLLQGGTRLFDVICCPAGTEKWVDRVFDLFGTQFVSTDDSIFLNVNWSGGLLLWRLRRLSLLRRRGRRVRRI